MPVKTFDWGGRFQAIFIASNGAKLLHEFGASPIPCSWDCRNGPSGFRFLDYSVPKDLPLHGITELEFRVLEVGRGFRDQYGEASIFIRRDAIY